MVMFGCRETISAPAQSSSGDSCAADMTCKRANDNAIHKDTTMHSKSPTIGQTRLAMVTTSAKSRCAASNLVTPLAPLAAILPGVQRSLQVSLRKPSAKECSSRQVQHTGTASSRFEVHSGPVEQVSMPPHTAVRAWKASRGVAFIHCDKLRQSSRRCPTNLDCPTCIYIFLLSLLCQQHGAFLEPAAACLDP